MKQYLDRKLVIGAIIVVIIVIYIIRLFYLQVIDSSYKYSADSNVLRYETQYPARGLIYDRNGKLLVYNEAAYDLMIVPREVKAFDTLDFCNTLNITIEYVRENIVKTSKYSRYKPSIFLRQLSKNDYARLQEKLHKFKGFFVQVRTLRKYPDMIAGHVLGYIGEVDDAVTKKNNYYKSGDYIGISGIESYYEDVLRGKKGVKVFMVDVHNRIKGNFASGALDTTAIPGNSLISSLDAELQKYGEYLMQNKMGSVVAIEPSTGEVLALVSSPAYDPNLLVGRVRSKNYISLSNDSLKPLFNRALMAQYPPGSIFKIVESLIGLDIGVINENTGFPCNKSVVNCHNHPSASNLHIAIQVSCNPYYYNVYSRIIQRNLSTNRFKDAELGLKTWVDYAHSFGLGVKLGIDLSTVKKGKIPDVSFYNKWYGAGSWAFSTIYSNGIGQGEVEVIPLQMANLASIFANRGYYYTPHLIKSIEDSSSSVLDKYKEKHFTKVNSKYFEFIAEAMRAVVEDAGGTARLARIPGISVCGKTGTAQNPHGEDHAVFIAFAPKDNPKIAIAAYVENSGFGGTWAAPIASLMIEKYLTDSIKRPDLEQKMIETDFIHRKHKMVKSNH